MASVTIIRLEDETISKLLSGVPFLVHVNFASYDIYEKVVSYGFNPETWENSNVSNNNKIFIGGIHYKDFVRLLKQDEESKKFKETLNLKPQKLHKGKEFYYCNVTFGEHTFRPHELGELLDTLMKENENKKYIHELSERLRTKLKEGVSIDEAYKEVYGFDYLIKK